MTVWPENNKPASFMDLVTPLINMIKGGYTMKRKKGTPKYEGLTGLARQFGNREPIKEFEYLADWKERGYDLSDVVIMAAVWLGIEQGRRMIVNDTTIRFLDRDLARIGIYLDRAKNAKTIEDAKSYIEMIESSITFMKEGVELIKSVDTVD